jgi:hypothetical protein
MRQCCTVVKYCGLRLLRENRSMTREIASVRGPAARHERLTSGIVP